MKPSRDKFPSAFADFEGHLQMMTPDGMNKNFGLAMNIADKDAYLRLCKTGKPE